VSVLVPDNGLLFVLLYWGRAEPGEGVVIEEHKYYHRGQLEEQGGMMRL